MSFVVDLIAMIFGMPRALFPQMAHESFGGPVEGGTTMALLAAAMSAGAVAGGLFSGWLPRIRRQGLAVVACDRGLGGRHGRLRPRRRIRRRARRACFSGLRWPAWLSAVRRTWCRRRSGRRSCSRRRPMTSRPPAGGVHRRRCGRAATGRRRPRCAAAAVGTTVAAAGGGALVVIGMVACAVLVPAFVRYRVADDDKV